MDIKKKLYKNVISDYDFGRPQYPEAVYDAISNFSSISTTANILEVGAGTGQATDLFLAHGHKLDLLEVSDEQVAFLKKKYREFPNINIEKAYFEDYEAKKEYDLIYSATAFHWIKCENGYPKAWKMLRDGGTMAVFWNIFFDVCRRGGIFDKINAIKDQFLPNAPADYEVDEIEQLKKKRISQITVNNFFNTPKYYEFRWLEKYSSQRFSALVGTDAKAMMLSKTERASYLEAIKNCIDSHGGTIEVPEIVCLYLVQKT